VASSDKAYGELVGNKYLENHPLNGIYPYDASKSATDLVSSSYRKSYNLPIIVTRACNIYGIGDYNRQRLIPGIVYSHLRKSEFIIRNGGRDFREYIHVEDAVDAYVKLLDYAETNNAKGAFNISSGDAFSTLELFNLIQSEIGVPIKHSVIDKPSLEIVSQFMDAQLITLETGWSPKYNMKKSIGEIVKWYLKNI
jgi:CDP-glucose 4,6-dehydratase